MCTEDKNFTNVCTLYDYFVNDINPHVHANVDFFRNHTKR